MKKNKESVYVLGETDTTIFPVSMDDAGGNLDFVGVAFSNKKYLTGNVPTVKGSDLVIGFKTVGSIDVMIARLQEIREVLLEERK